MSAEAWTVERVEKLRGLVDQGATAGEIELELSCGISRNAVIGKVHRLGLAFKNGRSAAGPGSKPQPRKRAPSAPGRPAVFDMREDAADISPVTPAIDPVDVVEGSPGLGGVDHDGLKPHHCRWPSGDPRSPDFRYCGAARTEGKPYCAPHVLRASDPNRRV